MKTTLLLVTLITSCYLANSQPLYVEYMQPYTYNADGMIMNADKNFVEIINQTHTDLEISVDDMQLFTIRPNENNYFYASKTSIVKISAVSVVGEKRNERIRIMRCNFPRKWIIRR